MTKLTDNTRINAADLRLNIQPVPPEQSVDGQPCTGATAVADLGEVEIGAWEMTPGVMRDIEAEEVFVVVSGSATVEFADGAPTLRLGPGDVVRLAEGAETIWTVTETLRKIYITTPRAEG
jgi:uncharacterized protein